jgi:cytochrome c oxidase subunit 1
MPRRAYDYLPQFHTGHLLSTIGAFILITGLLLMLFNFLRAGRRGAKAPANPWHGVTLEWKIPSPPPHENFDVIPEITTKPYFFGTKDENKA